MIAKKYTYKLTSKNLERFKAIQKEAQKIYLEHLDAEFEFYVNQDDKSIITEIIKFKTFDDYTKADSLDDERLDQLILSFREVVDFDTIIDETLLELKIEASEK